MTDKIETPRPGLEIATTGDGRDITKPFTTGLMQSSDRVLTGRGGGDLQIYEQVASDTQVKACFEQRRSAVTSREWVVEPASDRRADRKAADFGREQLKRVGWDRVTDRMLWGVFYGFSPAELIWQVQDGKLGWEAIKVRNRRRFRFDVSGELRLLTPQNMLQGEPAKPPYFWHIATGADNDDEPYGLGLAHWCYWPVLFKRHGIGFWLTFLEKFGMPTGVGKFPANASDAEIMKLLGAIRAIRTDSGVAIPQGMEIDLLEAARSGAADYEALHDKMDEAIAKAILGQTMTTDNGSSQAQADVHMEVRQDIVKADADLICESFNEGPMRWLTMFNFDGADPPRVYRVVEEPDDLDALADRDTKVKALGFKPSLDYVKQQYGDHWEPVSPAPAAEPAQLPPPPAFAAGDDAIEQARIAAQKRLDAVFAVADALALAAQPYVRSRVRELQVLLDETGDLAEFAARLNDLADADPDSEFVEALARGGFAAWLVGRTKENA
jgi:phage gp29-like protein